MSHVDEPVEAQAAEFDFRIKVHARRFAGLLEGIDEAKGRLAHAGSTASEQSITKRMLGRLPPRAGGPGFGDRRRDSNG